MTGIVTTNSTTGSKAQPAIIEIQSDASSDLSDAPPPSEDEDEKTSKPSATKSPKGQKAPPTGKKRNTAAITLTDNNGKLVIAEEDSSEEEQYIAPLEVRSDEDSQKEAVKTKQKSAGQKSQPPRKKQKRLVTHRKAKGTAIDTDDKKPHKAIAAKGTWVQSLPQPAPPPSDSPNRKGLNHDDILYVFHKLLTNFLAWKPQPVPNDSSTSASASASAPRNSPDSPKEATSHIGENRYNFLERRCGIMHRHRFGWGEYMRGPFAKFVSRVFQWVQSGGKDRAALEGLSTKVEGVDWTVVLESWWSIEEIRPAWKDIQVERGLGKGGNEMVRLRFGTVLRKLCTELTAVAEKRKHLNEDDQDEDGHGRKKEEKGEDESGSDD